MNTFTIGYINFHLSIDKKDFIFSDIHINVQQSISKFKVYIQKHNCIQNLFRIRSFGRNYDIFRSGLR